MWFGTDLTSLFSRVNSIAVVAAQVVPLCMTTVLGGRNGLASLRPTRKQTGFHLGKGDGKHQILQMKRLSIIVHVKKNFVVRLTASSGMGIRERESRRRGGGGGREWGHERRARKRTGWKVHIESKTQVC